VGLGVIAGEIDVADHRDHPRPDDLQPQIGHPGDLRRIQQGLDGGRANPRVCLLTDQELPVPCPAGSGLRSSWMPCATDTVAPATNSPSGEHRSDACLPAVPERVREVEWAPGPPVGNHQEDLVTGVCPGMRRLGQGSIGLADAVRVSRRVPLFLVAGLYAGVSEA
jgi:hypothetical protein